MNPMEPITKCTCCGSTKLSLSHVLWPSLIQEWAISDTEVEYINRQQGLRCMDCGASLRTMALSQAIMRCLHFDGVFKEFVRSKKYKKLKVLEINTAGNLTQFLRQMPGHVLVTYPQVDMMGMPFQENQFDLVVHSDTLEHVQDPIKALAECRRVLKNEGYCVYSVPIIVGRLTRSRKGLPPSYHGIEDRTSSDYLVYTEYGADAWEHLIIAGFSECRILSLEYPAAQVLIGVKTNSHTRTQQRSVLGLGKK